jgi:hypothetical protein
MIPPIHNSSPRYAGASERPSCFTQVRQIAKVVAPPAVSSQQSPHTGVPQRAHGPAAVLPHNRQRASGAPPSDISDGTRRCYPIGARFGAVAIAVADSCTVIAMRSCLICITLAVIASPAHATPETDVETIVRSTIDHLADPASTANLAKGATVIGIHANVFDVDTTTIKSGEHDEAPIDFTTHGKLWPMVFGKEAPAGTRKLGKVMVVVDATGQTAWFAAPLELSGKRTMHVSGLATRQDGHWLVRVFGAELAVPDSELAKHPVLAPRIAQTPATPPNKLGKAIVGWFKDHSLAKHAASGVVLAGGSAPPELASGADAIKLVGTLDRINMLPIAIDGADTASVVIGTAWLPISKKEQDGVIQFGFAVYVVSEAGEWKWKSIQFAADQVPQW